MRDRKRTIYGPSYVLLALALLAVSLAQAAPFKKTDKKPPLRSNSEAGAQSASLPGKTRPGTSAKAGSARANLPGRDPAKPRAGQLKIANIARNSGKVTAVDSADGRTIEFQVSDAKVLKALNLGQRVWLEAGRGLSAGPAKARQLSVKVVEFPIETDEENKVATGHMKTKVKLSNTGVLTGTTRTWTNNEIQGFTGGVKAELQDRDGNVLKWDMPVQTYGVNAKALTASAPSSRTADWRFDVPTDIVNQTARIRILHRHTPKGRLDEFVDIAWKLGKLAEFYVGLAQDVGAVASGGQGPGGTGPTEPAP